MGEPVDYVTRFERNRKIGIAVIIGVLCLPLLFLFVQCGRCMWSCSEGMQAARERREASSQVATPEQIAAVDSATTAFEASLAAKTAAWQLGMARAVAVVPRPDLGPCPIRLPLRQPYDASRSGSFNNLDSFSAFVFPGRQGFPHTITNGGLPSEPPGLKTVRSRAAELRTEIRQQGRIEDLAAIVQSAQELGQRPSYDVVLFADVYHRPFADVTGQSFSPGVVRGVAVLYDYSTESVACAGEVAAENTSQTIDYTAQFLNERQTLQGRLDAEFDSEVERAIARSLRWRAGERAASNEADAAPAE